MSSTRLLCGANVQEAEGLVGRTVGDAREAYGDILNIPPEAEIRRGGEKVAEDHVIQEAESYEFIKPAGSKG